MESLKEKRETEGKLEETSARRRPSSSVVGSESFKSSPNGFLYKKPETRHVQYRE